MKKENTAIRLKTIMNMRGLRQVDILNLTVPYCQKYSVKMNKSDISQYCSGKTEPNQEKLFILGNALNVSEAWLMGFDVPMERVPNKTESVRSSSVSAQCKEIIEVCNQLSPHNRKLCIPKNIRITLHAAKRLEQRRIFLKDVIACIMNGEIIEQYPDDYPYPSCLILGMSIEDKYLHVVIGNHESDLFLITAYFPSFDKWESDFKTRKENA